MICFSSAGRPTTQTRTPSSGEHSPATARLEWSEEYAKLVTQAARPLDQKTRFELYARADRMICEQAIILPVAYNTACALMKPWIRREPKWYARGGCWKDVIIDPH